MNLSTRIKSLGFALLLVLSLGAVQPTSAVEARLNGPADVSKTNTARFTAAVGVDSPDASLESLTLTFRPVDGEGSVSVTLGPDGTVRRVDPPTGVVGSGEIRVGLLRRTLVVDAAGDASGYGYGSEDATYDVRVDARALKQGAYEVTLTAACDGGATSSDTTRFAVTLPSADERSTNATDDAPAGADATRSVAALGAAEGA